jgi:hypothetical protein
VVESDMSNLDQQVVEELCLMWNRRTLCAPFISGFLHLGCSQSNQIHASTRFISIG